MTYGWHWHCLLGRNISRTTANNVSIICICPNNVWMTCTYTDNMWTMSRCDMQRKPSTQIISQIIYMILKWNNSTFLRQIPFNNQFLSEKKDSLGKRWPWGVLQMTCRWHMCLQTMCRSCTCLWMTCRWCADDIPDDVPDDICHPPAKSPMKSHSHVIHTSSACHPHVICVSSARCLHETSSPKIFPVMQQSNSSAKNWELKI